MIIVKDAPKGLKVNVGIIGEDNKEFIEKMDVLFISFSFESSSEYPDEFADYYGVLFPDGIAWVTGKHGVYFESGDNE